MWNGWSGRGRVQFNISDHRPQVYQRARKTECVSCWEGERNNVSIFFQRLRYLSSGYRGISHTPNAQTWPAMTFSHFTNAHTLIGWQMCPISILPHKKLHAFIILSPEDLCPPSHFIPLSYPSIKPTAQSDKKCIGFYMLMSCYPNTAQYV